MTREKKQVFTRRITQANRTQLVVILYEMIQTYLEDGVEAYKRGDMPEFHKSLGFARDCIAELRMSLDFSYDLSQKLFAIYIFADKELARNISGNKIDTVGKIADIFGKLHDAYQTVSREDTSAPLMANTQSVYAGFTYGRTDVNESLAGYEASRGYYI